MANEEITAALREMAALLELKGESSFQVRAYRRAADRLLEEDDLAGMIRDGRSLMELPGIGKALAEKIVHFIGTGSIPQLEKLRGEVPPGVVEMASLSGLGPGRVGKLRDELGVESVEELEAAIAEGRLEKVKGFAARTIGQISSSIDLWKRNRGVYLHRVAREEAEEILARVLEAGASDGAVAGRLGRWHETVTSIDLVAASRDPAALAERLAHLFPDALREDGLVDFAGETGIPVRLAVVSEGGYGAARLWRTSSEAHRARLEGIARERGILFDRGGMSREGEALPTAGEQAAYGALGLAFIPPELRESGEREVDLARTGGLPELIERSDIRGVLHNHSTWSDGKASIRAMAEHARSLGYEYFGIADHSRTAGYAGGLSVQRLEAQREEVAKLRREMAPFRIFHGIESDILRDGSLDYDEGVLRRLDYVVASIHSRYGMDGAAISARMLGAVGNRLTTILGHPSGRLLTEREAYDYDRGAMWEAATEHGTAIELNAHEKRLDVEWHEMPAVTGRGLRIAFSPDAHTRKGLGDIDLAVRIARKGWLTRRDVINCMDVEAMEAWLEERRGE